MRVQAECSDSLCNHSSPYAGQAQGREFETSADLIEGLLVKGQEEKGT